MPAELEKAEKTIVIVNRGLGPIILKNKKVVKPGESAEVSAEEGKQLLNFKHVADAAKIVPQQGDKVAKLEAENAKLRDDLAKSKKADDDGDGKTKGKK